MLTLVLHTQFRLMELLPPERVRNADIRLVSFPTSTGNGVTPGFSLLQRSSYALPNHP